MDIDALLAPLGGPDPCGENLEYDPQFAELERLAEGKPEQQIGNTVIPATEPEWNVLEAKAMALFARSKDLRLALQWTRARLRIGGLTGLAQGLTVLRDLVDHYWDGVHPRLDPADGNDPTMRVNVLLGLTAPDLLAALRTTPLISARTVGRFSLKDIEVASGEVAVATGEAQSASPAVLDAALAEMDVAALTELSTAARGAVEAVGGIGAAVTERVGAGGGPNLESLERMLRKIDRFLTEALARRQPAAAPADGLGAQNGASGPAVGGATRAPAFVGELTTRDDVIRALDQIISYYERHEPSSPVPMFVERCKRLVRMSFLDIVRELVPDAMTQIEVLKGRQE